MSEIKVSLNIKLPGRVLLSQEAAKALEKQGLAGYEKHNIVVNEWNPRKKRMDQETLQFKTRRWIPAVQTININKEAYAYMTGKEIPVFSTAKEWSRMGKKLKLEMHLNEIAEALGGKVMSYHIFED